MNTQLPTLVLDEHGRRLAVVAACLAASVMPGHAALCEASAPERFEDFIVRFSTHKDVELARTRLPLPVTRLNPDDLEAPPIRSNASRADIAKTPTLAARARVHGLAAATEYGPGRAVHYKVFKPDTGWQMVYHFRLHGNCWWLELFEDESL